MAGSPTVIDIHHELGRAEAKRRMAARVGDLSKHIPGGMAHVTSSWPLEDRMAVEVSAMGQTVPAILDVEDHVVRVSLMLPPMLSFMSGMISSIVRQRGEDLLLEDRSKTKA